MAFWNRNSDTELPASQVEYREPTERRWPALFAYIILALLISTAIVMGGRWVYNKATDSSEDNPAPTATQQSEEEKQATNDKKAEQNESSSSNSGSSSSESNNSSDSSSQNSEESGTGGTSPNALPDNGPAGVIALFVGSSLAAAGLHYIVSLRRNTES